MQAARHEVWAARYCDPDFLLQLKVLRRFGSAGAIQGGLDVLGTENVWLKKKNPSQKSEAPEMLRYSRYYEHDGALRAYANRAMVLAFLCIPVSLLSLAFTVYVRLQPPTVIRVDEDGQAMVLGVRKPTVSVAPGPGSEPTEFEKRAFVRLFLERYLNFSPTNVSRNWAESLNMMTANLRRTAYAGMQKDDLIGKIEDDQTTSEFQLRSVEASRDEPVTYTVFGVKEVHHIHGHNETIDKVVSEFHLRLLVERRSEENPSGLLIGEYWEREIEGEKRDWVLQQANPGLR